MAKHNNEILAYALNHLEKERDDLQAKIDTVRKQLGVRVAAASSAASSGAVPAATKGKRVLSASARRRIAAAQKRRWAAHRKAKKAAAKA